MKVVIGTKASSLKPKTETKQKQNQTERHEAVPKGGGLSTGKADARTMLQEKRATTLIMAAQTFFVRVWRPAAISRHSSRQCRALS